MNKLPFPHVIDSSMRGAFSECPQKFYRQYLQGLRLPGNSIHLHFGGMFAKGLEVVRKAYWGDKLSASAALLKGAEVILKEWGQVEAPVGSAKTLERCLDALDRYFKEYPLETDFLKPFIFENGTLGVECSFALPLETRHPQTKEPLLYAGRFDLLAQHGNSIYIVDEKTTGSLGASWAKQFNNRAQFTGYTWGAKSYGLPIAGVIIRGVGILKTSISFQQVIQQRPDWQIAIWKAQLERDCQAMIKCWEMDYYDYSLDSSCSSYGGCAYLPLCTSHQPEKWLDTYTVEFWEPLKRKGDIE